MVFFPPEVMSVSARALYDYTARSDKELSFKRGDTLKVIEKSPDGHWWDGLCDSNRGFIPVAYVEIIELQTTTASTQLTAIPAPPTRRSSMQDRKDDEPEPKRASEVPAETSILELQEAVREPSPEPPRVTLTEAGDEGKNRDEGRSQDGSPLPPSEVSKEDTAANKSAVPIAAGSVKSLSSKFKQPPAQQVLVQPHRKHTELSPRKSYDPPQAAAAGLDPEVINRSSSTSSGGGKVTQLTEQFKHRPGPPPPTQPRPSSHVVSPGADHSAATFHISPHSSTTGSPLQQAQLGSQLTPKPAPPGSKGTPSKPSRGSVVRRDKSQKKEDRPPLPSKPAAKPVVKPPPPKAPTQLQTELQAAIGKRWPTDK